MIQRLRFAWAYRDFVMSSILNEQRIRFAGSKLGGVWMLLHPLLEVSMYALILSSLMASRLKGLSGPFSYAIYLTAGSMAWSLFSEIINRCLSVFTANAHLLKKISFPAMCLPLIISGSALVSNLLLLAAVTAIFGLVGHLPSLQMLFVPLLIVATLTLALGIGLILGTLNVFMRDIGQIMPVVLQFAFWFTPIVYPIDVIPQPYRWIYQFNPMFQIVSAYQDVLVFHRMPALSGVLVVLLVGIVLITLAVLLYSRAKPEIVDML
ncbi:ABC transporter permease [Paraburkholderia sp. BR10954]|uniref:ABC transporter permease n=1 Tax=Paraburkholderia sp. BR10954 TaxID=3236995 RepID=UPI0034D2A48B